VSLRQTLKRSQVLISVASTMAVEIIPRKLSTPLQSTPSVAEELLQSHSHGGIDVLSTVCLEQIAERLAGGDEPLEVSIRDLHLGAGDLAQPGRRQWGSPELVDAVRHFRAVDEPLHERKRSRSGVAGLGRAHLRRSCCASSSSPV
jgi:hypothetical protein